MRSKCISNGLLLSSYLVRDFNAPTTNEANDYSLPLKCFFPLAKMCFVSPLAFPIASLWQNAIPKYA